MDDATYPSPPHGGGPAEPAGACLCFRCGGKVFAIRVLEVDRVFAAGRVDIVPDAPPFLLGLKDVEDLGAVPVMDLAARLGVPHPSTDAQIVMLTVQGRPVGIAVDRVTQVVTPEPDRVRSEADPRLRSDGILAHVELDGRLVPILDATALVGRWSGADAGVGT